ncbi:MAG TPA: VOC family protein [Pirellulales bacterium]|jgi:hypothetical protein|nr:VOC family protein [Pirellulales bacterium]
MTDVSNVTSAARRLSLGRGQAAAAGAQVKMPLMDMFWDDRYGKLADPFGYEWSLASHIEDVPPEEMKKRGEAMMAKMGECKP